MFKLHYIYILVYIGVFRYDVVQTRFSSFDWSFSGFVLNSGESVAESRIPLFYLRVEKSLGRKTFRPLFEFTAWSLRFLEKGELPECDYHGAKIKGSSCKRKLGQTFCLAEFRGDWKWIVELLGLTSGYNRRNICHRCAATHRSGPLQYANFELNAAWINTERSNRDFLRSCVDLLDPFVNPLLFLSDFNVANIKACYMHVAHLGIGLFANGSAIMTLMLLDLLGPGTQENKLEVLWSLFQDWKRRNRIAISMPRFRNYCLHIEGHIFYQSKAWHSRVLTSFLAATLVDKCKGCDDSNLAMTANCMFNLSELYNNVEKAPRYMSEAAA